MKSNRKIHTRITQKEIDLVKALLEAGIKKSKIKEISGRSGYSIKIIERSDGTLKGYHHQYHLDRDEWLKKVALKNQKNLESASSDQEAESVKAVETPSLFSSERELDLMNSLRVMNQRLDHIEKMMGDHYDSHQAELTLLKSKKIIW